MGVKVKIFCRGGGGGGGDYLKRGLANFPFSRGLSEKG